MLLLLSATNYLKKNEKTLISQPRLVLEHDLPDEDWVMFECWIIQTAHTDSPMTKLTCLFDMAQVKITDNSA